MLMVKNNLKNVCGLLDYIYLCSMKGKQRSEQREQKKIKKSSRKFCGLKKTFYLCLIIHNKKTSFT